MTDEPDDLEPSGEVDEQLLIKCHYDPTPDRLSLMNPNTAVEWDRRVDSGWFPYVKPEWENQLQTVEDVLGAFSVTGDLYDEYKTMAVIAAFYSYEDYSGKAEVYFSLGNTLFENHGSHCSCYGLEGQWKPEPVQPDELRSRMVKRVSEYDYWDRSPVGFAENVLSYLAHLKT